jgi:hypothetical protein
VGTALPRRRWRTFRAGKASIAAETFEGRAVMRLEGEWRTEMRDVPTGSLFVPIAQPKSHLVMTLFEPRGARLVRAWGSSTPLSSGRE